MLNAPLPEIGKAIFCMITISFYISPKSYLIIRLGVAHDGMRKAKFRIFAISPNMVLRNHLLNGWIDVTRLDLFRIGLGPQENLIHGREAMHRQIEELNIVL